MNELKAKAIETILGNHEAVNSIAFNNWWCPSLGTVVDKNTYLAELRKSLEDESLGLLIALTVF